MAGFGVLAAAASPAFALPDADADGFPQATDCDDSDPAVWAVPGEALQLRFTNKTTLTWSPPASRGGLASTLVYDTLRSTSPSNFASAPPNQCFDPAGSSTSSTDPANPPVGTAFYYLVRAKNSCGDATLGARSSGTPRVGMTCDCSLLCDDGNACTRDRCADGACAHDVIAPVIQLPPSPVAACPGDTTRFTVRASGQGTLHYVWKSGPFVVGNDAPDLTMPVSSGDNGVGITCAVTDSCATATSAPATLTVFSSAASCSGGGNGLEAPNGASEVVSTGVYEFSGEFYLEATDLAIEGRGFDFVWSRKYRSREGRLTAMGQSWDFSYNRSVALDSFGNLIVADGNSRRDTYTMNPSGCWTATGFFREACPQVDGSIVLEFPDRTTWKFAPLDGSPAQGKIVQVQDRNANAMTFAYDGAGRLTAITDTLGRPITVLYNSDGFVSAVTDFGGRQVTYGYASAFDPDGSPGDLRTVTSPPVTGTPTGNDFPAGKTTTYTYSKAMPASALDHNLLSITDPAGSVVLRNVYAPEVSAASPRFDRLDRQILPNGSIDYVYVAQTPGPGDDSVTKTIVRDRMGNVRELFFNAAHQLTKLVEYTGRAPSLAVPTDDTSNRPAGPLRATDPPFFETHLSWSPDSLLSSVTWPEGNSVQLTYDAANPDVRLRANLLEALELPGPRGGDQPSITQSWSYATAFGGEPCAGTIEECGGGTESSSQSVFRAIRVPEGPVLLDAAGGLSGVGVGYAYAKKAAIQDNQRKNVAAIKTFVEQAIATNQAGGGSWTSHTDGLGRTYVRDIDPVNGNILQLTAPLVTTGVSGGLVQSIVESWAYDGFGRVTSHTLPSGRVDEYAYYSSGPQNGYLQSVTVDAPGSLPGSNFALLTVTARDAYGNATAVTDPRGHTASFVFNQLDQVVRRVSKPPFGYQTDYYYDADDRLISMDAANVDENGVVEANAATSTLYYYDALSRLVKTRVEPDTVQIDTEYQYDGNGHVTLERRPEAVNGHQPANTIRSLYDERDLVFRRTRAESDPRASTTQWNYDGNGRVLAIQQGLESGTPHLTTTTRDGYDRRVLATNSMGSQTTTHYDANGNVTSERTDGKLIDGVAGSNVRLSEATTTYDEVNRPVQVDVAFFDTVTGAPIGDGFATTKRFYDSSSRVIRTEDDNGHGDSFTFDSADRLASSVDDKGNTRSFTYDPNSNVVTTTESEYSDLPTPPEVFVTTSTYDNLDRRTSTTDPIENTVHDAYDSRGNVRRHLDARNNVTRYTYDGANRLVGTARDMTDTGDGSGSTLFVLDATRSQDDESRLVSETDDNGNTTTYQYDPLDRLTTIVNPDGTSELRSYDVFGNVIQRVDANGTVTATTFDAADRPTARSITRAPGVLGTTAETWEYDGLSRVVHAENDGSAITRQYDSLSDVTFETQQIGAGPARSISASFDGARNPLSLVYPSGLTVSMTLDPLDRNKTITTAGPNVCDGGPTPGVPCSSDPPCGPGGHCQPLAPWVVSYDYAGPDRVLHSSCCESPHEDVSFNYDAARRVTRTTHTATLLGTNIDDRIYAWDPTDNKTSVEEVTSAATGTTRNYAYDSASRMVGAATAGPGSPPAAVTYSLDGVGNRVLVVGGSAPGPYAMSATLPEPADRQVNQYTSTPFDGAREYDRNGNLVHKPGTGDTMSYDYRNRLVLVSGSFGSASYSYDAFGRRIDSVPGRSVESYGDMEMEERDASGTLTGAFVYGNGPDDAVIVLRDFNGDGALDRGVLHRDDMGNVVAVTDGQGNTLERYAYGDFGQPRFFDGSGASIPQSVIGNPFLFNGRRYDAETGLYFYRTRYLDPAAGRFTSRDSIGAWGDEASLGNGYTFAGNNPQSATDPWGTAQKSREYLYEKFQDGKIPTQDDFATGDRPTQAQFENLIDSFAFERGDRPTQGQFGSLIDSFAFERGDRPTQAQFGSLIDSMVNRSDDRFRPMAPPMPNVPPPSPSGMQKGKVKFFNETKGFGFVKAPGSGETFDGCGGGVGMDARSKPGGGTGGPGPLFSWSCSGTSSGTTVCCGCTPSGASCGCCWFYPDGDHLCLSSPKSVGASLQ